MCRGKVKNGGLWIELERKSAGLRSELGEREHENAVLRSELGEVERCGSLERTVGRICLVLWPAANPGAPRQSEKCRAPEWARRARLRKPAVGSKISKIMISGTAKIVKRWCSGADYFKICENDMLRIGKFRAENGGLSHGTYPICIWKYPPPPDS